MPCHSHAPSRYLAVLLLLWTTFSSRPTGAAEIDYQRDIKPIVERCRACHGALQQQGSLRLDTAALMRHGGDSGPAVVPGNAEESLLLQAVTGSGGMSLMPPAGEAAPLTPSEIDRLRDWINQGAVAPADEPIPQDPSEHWAFQSPERPAIPSLFEPADIAWIRTPVDAFIRRRQKELGLQPASPASQPTLLRRVYLDLVGLPPTPEAVESFLADDTPDAYERVVQQLLDSPQYGERWGRHWMDVWRYGDWAGYGKEIRESQYHLWRWRDWIVESLNADRPYDQMILEMLAGDEIAPTDPSVLRATGYLGRSWYKFNRNVWLDNTVEHTGKAFLGLTLNCARCHDHKYDPISQTEYYQLRAIFEAHDVRYDPVPGEPDVTKDGVARVFDKRIDDPTYLFVRGNEAQPDKDHPLDPELPALFGTSLQPAPVQLPPESFYPAIVGFLAEQTLRAKQEALAAARTKWEQVNVTQVNAAEHTTAPSSESQGDHGDQEGATREGGIPSSEEGINWEIATKEVERAEADLRSFQARLVAERAKHGLDATDNLSAVAQVASQAEREAAAAQAELAALQARQQLHAARQAATLDEEGASKTKVTEAETKLAEAMKELEAARNRLTETSEQYSPLGEIYPQRSTGRRLALARWITSRHNPLTARVAVNQIWMRHFGKPLVSSVFDMGLNGNAPTHPELLDWLAVELMENGWQMKALHRLIVLSSTYRQDSMLPKSSDGLDPRTIDPDNQSLWRMNTRRMEAEVVRDSLLSVGGSLDLTMGGPEIDEQQGQAVPRRSLYFRHGKEKEMVFTKVFDGPGVSECYQRGTSVVPQQSLALANSPLAKMQARLLAGKLTEEIDAQPSEETTPATSQEHDRAFVHAAYWRVLARDPHEQERSLCLQFLTDQASLLSQPLALTPVTVGQASSVAPAESPRQRARENLVHVLLNHHDFVTIH